MLLALVQILIHQEPQVFLFEAAFQLLTTSLSWCLELLLPRGRALHFLLLNLMGYLPAHSSSSSRSLNGSTTVWYVNPVLYPLQICWGCATTSSTLQMLFITCWWNICIWLPPSTEGEQLQSQWQSLVAWVSDHAFLGEKEKERRCCTLLTSMIQSF